MKKLVLLILALVPAALCAFDINVDPNRPCIAYVRALINKSAIADEMKEEKADCANFLRFLEQEKHRQDTFKQCLNEVKEEYDEYEHRGRFFGYEYKRTHIGGY